MSIAHSIRGSHLADDGSASARREGGARSARRV